MVPSSESAASFYFNPDPVNESAERSLTLCSFALVNDDGVLYVPGGCVCPVCVCVWEGWNAKRRGGRERKSKMCMCAFPCCLATFEFPLSLSFICELLAVISSNPFFTALIYTHWHIQTHKHTQNVGDGRVKKAQYLLRTGCHYTATYNRFFNVLYNFFLVNIIFALVSLSHNPEIIKEITAQKN